MTAYAATIDQADGRKGLRSLTPPGLSQESSKIQDAKMVWLKGYYALPASRHRRFDNRSRRLALQDATEDLYNVLVVYWPSLSSDVRERIAERIETLTDPTDWDAEDELPNAESFRRLLVFLASHHEFRNPSIFLNRYGHFTASWRPERRQLASLVFHADNNVNWLVFTPRPDNDDDVIEAAGRSPIELVLGEVRKHGAFEWMRRK